MPLLQIEHNRQIIRIDQVQNGAPPKPKNAVYANLNRRILQNKRDLEIWLNANINAHALEIETYILQYMDRMQYLLSGQTPRGD